jgi:hypothetical protein
MHIDITQTLNDAYVIETKKKKTSQPKKNNDDINATEHVVITVTKEKPE